MPHRVRFAPPRTAATGALLVSIAVVAACGGGIAPLPPSPPPGAAPPPVVEPAPTLFRLASGERRVVVESRAMVRVISDSATAEDTVSTTAWLRYRIGDGASSRPLEVTVDSLLRSGGARMPGPAAIAHGVRLTGSIVEERVELAADSASAADCSSPAGALQALARDVLPSIPARLAPGARWEESVTTTSCRGGAVLTTLSRHRYEVPRDGQESVTRIRIRRSSEIRISGAGTVGGESITARGEGHGAGELIVDRAAGRVVESSTRSRIELTFVALGQEQRVVQEGEQRLRALDVPR